MSTLLVTGAKGFVGRNVARHFSRLGWKVEGIGHGEWAEEEWSQWGLTRWKAASISVENLKAFQADPDLVIHCAGGGSVPYSLEHPREEFQRTVGGTVEVLEYLRLSAKKIPLVYPSSAAVYGTAKELPIPESAVRNPISPYGVFRQAAEDLLASYASTYCMPVAVVRFFSIYGPGLRKQLLWDACKKILNQDTSFFGTGKEQRDWLHVIDAAKLLELAAKNASISCPVWNGASGNGTPIGEVIRILAAELGSSATIAFRGEARAGDPVHYVGDLTRLQLLGFQPVVDLRDGIREYARWFRENS